MHLSGSKIGYIELSISKKSPCLSTKPMVKVKGNLMADGYANNSVATIWNGLVANISVYVISNGHV